MRTSLFLPACLAAALSITLAVPVHASNGGAAAILCASGMRIQLGTVPEPDSGALMIAVDTRNNTTAIYAQRLDRHGHPLWGSGGLLVATLGTQGFFSHAIPDGSGGCLIAWDVPGGVTAEDVKVQRVLADGSLGYGAGGLMVCNAPGNQGEPQLAAGPSGSYYVVWKDDRNALGGSDIYAQRLTVAGAPQWVANGLRITAAAYYENGGYGNGGDPAIDADLSGGLLLSWVPDGTRTPRAQRVNSAGVLVWGANGVEFGASQDDRQAIAADGTGGAYVTYSHYAPFPTAYPYIQHVTAAGALGFATVGLALDMTGVGTNFSLVPVRDGSGGCFVFGVGNYGTYGGYAVRQQIASNGVLLRGNGEDIGDFVYQFGVNDLGNGVAVQTILNTPGSAHVHGLLQRYAYDGTPQFAGAGVTVGRDDGSLGVYPGGAVALASVTMLGFTDARYTHDGSANFAVFGQAFDAAGNPLWDDAELPSLASVKDAPADQGGLVRADWNAGSNDFPAIGVVTGYRAWRSVPGTMAARLARVHPTSAAGTFAFQGRTLLAHADAYWEMVGEEPAAELASYALTVPTGQDSTVASNADESFMIEAYDDSSHIWWSTPLTGHSVDNLAPPAPSSAAGYYAAAQNSTTLYWGGSSAPDLCCYDVFRGSSPDFVASPATRIGTTSGVTYTDVYGPAWYRIGARDVHGNLGPTALVLPAGTAAVGDGAGPRAWELRAAFRAGVLELALDVPRADEGALELFDVAGRMLWSAPFRAAAARSLAFTVQGGAVPGSGVVFARARSASGQVLTTRVVVLR
ncbi:MAG TPA: hypothetical protein VFK69_04255 [Candidatus Eisenbacteria bacterium]|nr:hypothetical protein [Candidatus Eisenbacteria bacterium]